ncbi:MAG: HAD family hydrolase [Flavobacterium sp.]|jgi:phosphoglycolate phosphatase-like HAD superfamily hydrolase|nr:HAD family hydrolase [Flavobacterium sp.]
MKLNKIQTLFWDFDGVVMDSNAVRDRGFEEVLNGYPKNEVDALMTFHQDNGGLSRYVKFRYFFEDIRGESITEAQVKIWAEKFSKIMMELLIKPDLLIQETLNFIKANAHNFNMHIVSGSDQTELRHICKSLDIAHYFNSIHGSPTPKNNLVATLLEKHTYNKSSCLLIGDSKNDFEAAKVNGIQFMGYGNEKIKINTDYKLF